MANNGYEYGTSPRKIEPEYPKRSVKKKTTAKKIPPKAQKKSTKKAKKKFKMSFEAKFFINSMLFFAIVFAIIACQAMVEQKYKEKESLKQEYNELLAAKNMSGDESEDVRILASNYGMQTKSATLIDLGTSDYIESAEATIEESDVGFWQKVREWFQEKF